MKSTERNTLLELGIFQNVIEVDSMNYGWERTEGRLRSRERYVGNVNDWGLVYSERDFYHVKFCVKRDDIGHEVLTWGTVFGVREISDTEIILYTVLLEPPEPSKIIDGYFSLGVRSGGFGDPRAGGGVFGPYHGPKNYNGVLSIAEITLDLRNGNYEIEERFAKNEVNYLDWGLIFERIGETVKVFGTDSGNRGGASCNSPPENCLLEYEFDEQIWDKNVFGIWGKEVKVHTALGYVRMKYGLNADYQDYKISWDEDGLMEADIELNRSQNLLDRLKGGNNAFLYAKPFRRKIDSTDLYKDMTMAFGGYIDSIEDSVSSGRNTVIVKLKSNIHKLDRFEENVIIEDIKFTSSGPVITKRDCFKVLEDVFEHSLRVRSYDHVSRNSEWHKQNDRIFSVNGNLLESAIDFAYYLKVIPNVRPVEEGIFSDVEVQNPSSGEVLTVRSDREALVEEENLILDLRLNRLIGENRYVNKVIGMSHLIEDDEEWGSMRSNRFKRLLGEELAVVEDQVIRLGDFVGTKEDISGIVEGFLDKQEYDWGGTITLQGSHHYLGGMHPQGKIVIYHGEKGMEGKEFRIAGFEITPFSTVIGLTQRPRIKERTTATDFEQAYMYDKNKNVFDDLRKTSFEVWQDGLEAFDHTSIIAAKLVGHDGLDITGWVPTYESTYKGYKYVDVRFDQDDFIGSSDHYNPCEILLKNASGSFNNYQLKDFYKHGSWNIDPDPYGTGETVYKTVITATIGLLQNNYQTEILDGYFVLGEISGGLGDPAAEGGVFGDPRGNEYIDLETAGIDEKGGII